MTLTLDMVLPLQHNGVVWYTDESKMVGRCLWVEVKDVIHFSWCICHNIQI
jgi:hypothetical protein